MTYDLVDLWFEHHERLPPELSAIALEQLAEQPSRLDGRVDELIEKLVEDWRRRAADLEEVHAVARLLSARTSREPIVHVNGEPTTPITAENYPLVDLITRFTKGVRPERHFATSFKIVSMVLMPHIVRSLMNPSK